jgi:hypothetical protein
VVVATTTATPVAPTDHGAYPTPAGRMVTVDPRRAPMHPADRCRKLENMGVNVSKIS